MNNENNHIKNFFKFLQEKEKRVIPISARITIFPETLKRSEILSLNTYQRSTYLNNIQDQFTVIDSYEFDSSSTDIFMVDAIPNGQSHTAFFFMNINGEIDVRGLDTNELYSGGHGYPEHLAAYFNSIYTDYNHYHNILFKKVFNTRMFSENHDRFYIGLSHRSESHFYILLSKRYGQPIGRAALPSTIEYNTIQYNEIYYDTKTYLKNLDLIKSQDKQSLNENTYKVYHGTNEKFSKFDFKRSTQGIIWFTDNIDSIKNHEHGGQGNKYIMTRYITINNPAGWDEYEKYGLQQLEDMGYDGVILPQENKTDYFVFSSKNISAKEPKEFI